MNWNERYAKKSAKDKVWKQLLKSYPEDTMDWVKEAHWVGPVEIPINQVDFSGEKTWAAHHDPALVKSKMEKIKEGKRKPVVLVKTPKNEKYIIIDGHHRSTAYKKLGEPITGFVAYVKREKGPWDEFHSKQYRDDPESQV
jgi:hypothetical protein